MVKTLSREALFRSSLPNSSGARVTAGGGARLAEPALLKVAHDISRRRPLHLAVDVMPRLPRRARRRRRRLVHPVPVVERVPVPQHAVLRSVVPPCMPRPFVRTSGIYSDL